MICSKCKTKLDDDKFWNDECSQFTLRDIDPEEHECVCEISYALCPKCAKEIERIIKQEGKKNEQ